MRAANRVLKGAVKCAYAKVISRSFKMENPNPNMGPVFSSPDQYYDSWTVQVKTLDELKMMNLSAQIREKPNWNQKMRDPHIVSNWRSECLGVVNQQMFDYVMSELEWYEGLKDGPVEPATVDGVWFSDSLIETDLKDSFVNTLATTLENVTPESKDYHPGSGDLVVDIVHPSLFCYVHGESKVLLEPIPSLDKTLNFLWPRDDMFVSQETLDRELNVVNRNQEFYSRRYQWLPAEFNVRSDGSVAIGSYINNLHPRNDAQLYSIIEKIFGKFVPLFNKVITNIKNPRRNRLHVDARRWYVDDGNAPNFEDDIDDEEYDAYYAQRQLKETVIPVFTPPKPPENPVQLAGRSLQVIVKIASIELTPEKPSYNGGVWHIEGMGNEKIVASGIYYFACDNISESRLEFRRSIDEFFDYEQNDNRGVLNFYGVADNSQLNQHYGDVITQAGRCIAFPNTMQHKVAPFELEDKTRNGYRKILVFFLVNPDERIRSTSTVPPQQHHWFIQECTPGEGEISRFPPEVLEHIFEFGSFKDLQWAHEHREALMEERKFMTDKSTEEIFERPFSLCEH